MRHCKLLVVGYVFLCVMEFTWVVSQLLVVGCVYESWSFSGMWVSSCLCVMEFSWNSSTLCGCVYVSWSFSGI